MQHRFLKLLANNLRLEFRSFETLALLIGLSLMLSAILSYGVVGVSLEPNVRLKLFSPCLWVVFVLVATVSIGRSFEYELEERALDALLLSGTPPYQIFLAKVFSNCLMLFVSAASTYVAIGVLLNVPVFSEFAGIVLVLALALFAYSSLATLLSGIAATSRLRQVLLPLILLPLLFPLFFAANELTASLLLEHSFALSSPWLSLLVGLNVVYLTLGINLFEHVIKE